MTNIPIEKGCGTGIDTAALLELNMKEDEMNYQYKKDFVLGSRDIGLFFMRGFNYYGMISINIVSNITAFTITHGMTMIYSGMSLSKVLIYVIGPAVLSLCIIFGVVLFFIFLFLWAWSGDIKKASNEFKKLFGEDNKDNKDKNIDTSLSSKSYLSKFNLKNLITQFFTFFEIDNILSEDDPRLTCRLSTTGNCDDIKHISGKYIKGGLSNKCYNIKIPENIEWKLNQYKPHHYIS